jgi:hypothetical protein
VLAAPIFEALPEGANEMTRRWLPELDQLRRPALHVPDRSAVTILCSSAAAAVEAMNSFRPAIAVSIAPSALENIARLLLRASISDEIVSVACLAWLARLFISEATTAKPRPASPARCGLDRGIERETTMPRIACAVMSVSVFHHIVTPAIEVEDRIVGGLDPDLAAALGNALVFGGPVLAAIGRLPELPVGRRVVLLSLGSTNML